MTSYSRHHHNHHSHYNHHYRHHHSLDWLCPLGIFILFFGLAITFVVAYYIKREQRKKRDLNINSNILITGASKGIGSQLAVLFAKAYRCNVILLDTSEPEILLSKIRVQGGRGHFYPCDFKDRRMVLRTIAEVIAQFGSIDIFINTGGITLEKKFEDYCHEEILAVMEANFFGPTILTKELLPIMKARGKGHIVNIPANQEMFVSKDVLAYCGTKTAFSKMLEGLRAELKLNGSKVKITVAKPLFSPSAEKESEMYQNMTELRVRMYAEKIFKGILYEAETI